MRRTPHFTFFFSKDDVFSNWYPASFEVDQIEFTCVEQAMMHAKAKHFGDHETAAKILATSNPKDHKALGRQVKPYHDHVWKAVCRDIVYQACRAKFTQNPRLLDILLSTGSTRLVEASRFDRVWGIGLSENDPRCEDPSQWKGTNWLGEELTRLRDDLVTELKPTVQVPKPR